MPPLARKLLIIAAAEGLLLTPLPLSSNGASTPHRRANNGPSRPTSPLSAAAAATVQIDYRTSSIQKLTGPGSDEPLRRKKEREEGLEVHGIAGLLHVSSSISYLVAITSRKQVALIDRIPVYVITDVALIPLASQATAQEALVRAREHRARFGVGDSDGTEDEGEVTEDEAPTRPTSSGNQKPEEDSAAKKGSYGLFAQKWFSSAGWTSTQKPQDVAPEASTAGAKSSTELVNEESNNQDVIVNPAPNDSKEIGVDGTLGSKSETKPENKPAPELESFPALPLSEEEKAEQSAAAQNVQNAAHSLTPKLLHTTRLLLASSRSFFFSYELDITRPLGQYQQKQKQNTENEGDALWTKVDPLYFWNKNLQRPFINSKLDAFILPLMQGFVAQTVFHAPVSKPTTEEASEATKPATSETKAPFILTIISRRSTKRAGLRYLRRGVDSEGNTANYVETEQLLSIPAPPPAATTSEIPAEQLPWAKTYSFLQIRGSIPVYFQQSPYALRPKPVLMHGETTNRTAFEKHFTNLEARYGEVYGVNLVERGSAENIVGEKYERYVQELNAKRETAGNDKKVGFNWFDFHKVCKGMKFEKVSLLIDELEDILQSYGWTEIDASAKKTEDGGDDGDVVKSMQTGIVRTNCMDCLDRTNVVQSACGRRALEKQLEKEGVDISKQPTDWFNLVWADNGDAISKQYASTAALKGDFTRTRKRNYRGALTDLGLTMSRYFTNIISDFFTQAAIDFLLGNVSNRVFDEFEVEMMSKDPAAELGAGSSPSWGAATNNNNHNGTVSGVRQNAIEICSRIVISDDFPEEQLIKGYTFLTPFTEGTLRTFPFQETVVLLTNFALYICKFDFTMEKVEGFERVDLRRIREVQVGTYITSTLAQASVEVEGNVGLIVRFAEGAGGGVRRVNTRTVQNRVVEEEGEGEGGSEAGEPGVGEVGEKIKFVAFKALPGSSAIRSENVIAAPVVVGGDGGGGATSNNTKPLPPAPAQLQSEGGGAEDVSGGGGGSGGDTTEDDEDLEDDSNPNVPARAQIRAVAYRIEKATLATFSEARKRALEKRRKLEGGDVDVGVGVDGKAVAPAEKKKQERGLLVREEDIISLEQAKKKTGLFEMVGYQVRRLVWA